MIGLPKYNDPVVTSANNLATEAMVEGPVENQGWNASHPSHAYYEGDVVAGWLKSAYLVAFAQFGYSWAFTPALVPVRAQIREPRKTHIERFWLYSPKAPRDGRGLVSVHWPRSMRSVVVVMGRFMIFLPAWGRDGRTDVLYDQLEQRKLCPPPRRSMSWRGIDHPWPLSPLHAIDLE